MGHLTLGTIPRSRNWRDVVTLLAQEAPDHSVIAASALAAERDLAGAMNDSGFVEAVRLLAMIPVAARADDFPTALRALDLEAGDAPLLPDLLAAVGHRLDHHAGSALRSDIGELARRALLGTLTREIGGRLPGLFEAEPADLRAAAAALAKPPVFSEAARHFFTRLTTEALASWLDRTLSAQIGEGHRFTDVADRSAFDDALRQHAAEATRIIREFAGGWYGKTLWREGTISARHAAGFAAIALRKIVAELKRRRDGDD